MVSEKRLRDILVSKDLFFAAAQPQSPDCTSMMFRNPQPIKETKTWMVLGEADDYTLAEDCVEQGERIKAKGGDIEIMVKKGWHHGFTANYEAEYEGDPMIFHNCPDSLMKDDGTYGTSDPNYKWAKEWWNDPCITRGANIGGTDKNGKKSWIVFKKPFKKFFIENLL